jgi:hypothetical protein
MPVELGVGYLYRGKNGGDRPVSKPAVFLTQLTLVAMHLE